MKDNRLAARPISAVDFEDSSGGYIVWALMPAIASVLTAITHAVTNFIYTQIYYEAPPYSAWVNIVIVMPLAVFALYAASRYRSPKTLDRKQLQIAIGTAAACFLVSVLSANLGAIFRGLYYQHGIDLDFEHAAIFNPNLYVISAVAWVLLSQAALRGVVIGDQLKNGATPRNAIITATAFQVLAFGISAILTLVTSMIQGWLRLQDIFVTFLFPSLVGAILLGVSYGILRVVTGRLWPCVAVAVLAVLFSPYINNPY
jgi:hypothetical protein